MEETEKPVIITLTPSQAQTLIAVLRQRIDTLENSADMVVTPGAKGRVLAQAEIVEQVLATVTREYTDYVEARMRL